METEECVWGGLALRGTMQARGEWRGAEELPSSGGLEMTILTAMESV